MDELENLFNRQIPVYKAEGQQKLRDSTVMVIGCGGLGSSCAAVLSRSGVGHLILVDDDIVSITNIHRQILYTHSDVGQPKAECAAVAPLLCLSKNTQVVAHVDEETAFQLVEQYKPAVVMDCTDNFDVRYAINYACAKSGTPMVFGSVTGGEGQVAVYCHTAANPMCPCFNCINPKRLQQMVKPPPVIPGICTTIATLQAQQAISIIIGVGDCLVGELATFNLLKLKLNRYKLRERNMECPVCGVGKDVEENK